MVCVALETIQCHAQNAAREHGGIHVCYVLLATVWSKITINLKHNTNNGVSIQ